MSFSAEQWAWTKYTGDAPSKLLLIALGRCAGPDAECWPSLDSLADETALSHDELKAGLDKLEASGLIRRQRRGVAGEQFWLCLNAAPAPHAIKEVA